MMFVFSSNTLIFPPECWKCILRARGEKQQKIIKLSDQKVIAFTYERFCYRDLTGQFWCFG